MRRNPHEHWDRLTVFCMPGVLSTARTPRERLVDAIQEAEANGWELTRIEPDNLGQLSATFQREPHLGPRRPPRRPPA